MSTGWREMPGDSIWISFLEIRSVPQVGETITVVRGEHKGTTGIVRAVDGGNGMLQIRTSDPEAWKAYDAETARMLKDRGYE